MNSIDIAKGMIFQRMSVSKDSFDDRLICQKKIYLLQSLGTDLGYTFNWYVRGPYSPSLTNYVYTNLAVLKSNDFSEYKMVKEVEDNIQRVNLLADDKGEDMRTASWYELLASLLYIHNNRNSWKIDTERSSLFDILMKYKPQYNAEQCGEAFQVLVQKGFVKEGN